MKESTTSKRKYRQYGEDFKKRAVDLLVRGRKAKELADDLGISESLLYSWKNKYGVQPLVDPAELDALKKRPRELEKDNAVLKKALRIFSRTD